ncbi:NUDIX domain-containing protein [Streptomyces sp. NPDC058698]|uniref:NUDIX domain-containing protein n=1 Tax=Streptomyces sp. NPDC058698 TaxID=3346606 RepID=UPI00364AC396
MPETPAPVPNSAPDSHCSSCGAPYGEGVSGWPRTCPACRATAYRNPLPVAVALQPVYDTRGTALVVITRAIAVALQPVYDTRGTALVVITRAIAPARGGTALPGGFIDHREDWRRAVVRELREETGIEAASRDVRLADAMSSPDGHLLLFGLLPERAAEDLPPFTPTDETEGRHLLRRADELAFPLHTLAVRAWFEGRYI